MFVVNPMKEAIAIFIRVVTCFLIDVMDALTGDVSGVVWGVEEECVD